MIHLLFSSVSFVLRNILVYFATQSTFNMNKEKALQSVNEIKELMERSSKFLSFSGLTAILAGVYALVGACLVYRLILYANCHPGVSIGTDVIVVASIVLLLATATACLLSCRKAKKTGQKLISKLTCRIAWSFSLPMFTGGLFCIALLVHGHYGLISSVMLLFYGLSLVNASKYTFSDVGWLGYLYLFLGLLDLFFEGHGLLFWTIGFGGFHVLYGILFYLQYERKK